MKKRFTILIAALAAILIMAQPGKVMGQTKTDPTVLFHETFGTGGSSARAWSDDYSVKSGVSAVYSNNSFSYTMSNLKQSNNNSGSAGNNGGAGLLQTTSGTDAEFISGPYNMSDYESLSVTYDWKAASIKKTYYTKLYYKTSSTATTWTEVTGGTGTGATTYVQRSYSLPTACQVETLYLKVAFNTSNTQALIDEFEITGTASGGGGTSTTAAPTISGNTPFVGSTTVTITNDASANGASIYYTLNGDSPTTTTTATCFAYSAPFSIDATTTVKAIAKKSTDTNASSVVSKTFTKILDNISDLTSQSAGSYTVTLTDALVTYVSGNNAYLEDASGAVHLYGCKGDLAVGDKITGTANVTYTVYNGLPEVTAITLADGYTKTTGNTVTPTEVTIATLLDNNTNYSSWLSRYVIIKNATVTSAFSSKNCTIEQNGSSITLRDQNSSATLTSNVDDVVNVTGNVSIFNSTKQIALWAQSQIVVVQDPTITTDATNNSLAVPNYVVGTAEPSYGVLTVNGSNLNDDITLSLGGSSNFEMSTDLDSWTNSLTLTQSEGSVTDEEVAIRLKAGLSKGDYNGTLTLSSPGATTKTVSLSGSVTGQTYAVNVATGLTGGSIEADLTLAEQDATVSLTAHPEDAYTFGSWSVYKTGDQSTTVSVSDNQFTMPAYAVDVTATFNAKPTYAVTCVANPVAGGTIATEQTPAYEGQSVELTITPTSGYSLSSVVITKTSDGSATDITVTNNAFTMPGYAVTATATFVSEIFNGTFMQVSSSNALENNGYYIIYNTSAMNSSISSGQMGATNVQISESTISNPNRAIVWKLVQNSSNWNLYSEKEGKYCFINGNETSSFSMGESSTTSFTVSYDNGFKFKSTHTNGRCIGYGNPFKSYADNNSNASANTLTLYKYTAGERTITFDGNGGTYNAATSYTQTVNDGIPTALANNQFTKANAVFAGWATSAGGDVVYANGAQIMIHDNTTLFAKWNQAYTATADDQITGGSVYIVIDANNQTTTNAAEGTEITLTYSADLGYAFSAWNVYYTENNQPVAIIVADNKFNMPAHDVTISATFEEATTYSLITNIDNLVSGRHYIIASGADGNIKAMGSQNSSHYRNVVPVSSNNGVIAEPENVYEFVINGPEIITKNNNTIMVYTIYDVTGVSGGYLYANSSSNNQMETQAFNDNNGKWTISIANTGAATIDAQGTNSKYRMRFNSDRFACYGSTTTQALPYIYVKNEVTPQYEFYKDIAAHTNATGLGNTDGWYFIASPVNSNLNPSAIDNMLTDETQAPYSYDLYRLNGNQLENYNNNEHTAGFVIANGAGYLYSNAANTTLKFSGTLIKEYNNTNKTVTPAHTGWNLIGNPFTFPVRVSRAFSELNNGSAVNSKDANSIINPGAGIIVYGTEGVTFTKYEPGEQSSGSNNINIMLAQQVVSRDGFSTTSVAIDNAVISFNENSSLPKFTLLEGNAKLYIPQYGDEYAIAFSDRQGEVPVCFKAKEVGTYTISFETQDFETNDRASLQGAYLIDVLEEEEIDLSVNPSYTFIGSPADRAERFKIVFRNNVNDIFAYQNGSDIVVTGEGELQIFDVMGRIVSKQYVSGVETIGVNAHGVYIIKLNGMTQKIIIK